MIDSTNESLKDILECEGVFMDKMTTFLQKSEDDSKPVYKRPIQDSSIKSVKDNKDENIAFVGFNSIESDCVKDSESEASDNNSESVAREVELQYFTEQQQMLPRVMEKYINAVVGNLEDHFAQKDLIGAMDCIVPTNIVKQKSISTYGAEDINVLVEHFGKQLDINTEKCLSEYKQYKRLVTGSYREKTMLKMTDIISEKYSEEMPHLLLVIQSCLVIPMSTAKCERRFSTRNRIKTKLRTQLNNKSLVDLMRISEDGPPLKDF